MTVIRVWLRAIDEAFIVWIDNLPGWIRPVLELCTIVGEPSVMALTIAALYVGGLWRQSSHIEWAAAAALLLLPLSFGAKFLVRRVRPETAAALGLHNYSFPSGHSYGSMLVLGLTAYLAFTRLSNPAGAAIAALAVLLIAAIGTSRVYLGAHYPTDVLAGWTLGALVLWAIIGLVSI